MKMPIELKKPCLWFQRYLSVKTTKTSGLFGKADNYCDYREDKEVQYEKRAVAFIDILGWGKAVEDSTTSAEMRKKLLNAVWFLGTQSKKDVEDDTPDCPSFDQASQFSDSVVISIPYSGYRDLMRLVRQITSYQSIMLTLGLPLRGGIAVGPLYHTGSSVFGPALNEAYRLESKVASHPRVIVAKSLDREIEMAAAVLPKHWPFVVKDDDGFYSTDYLMIHAMSQSGSDHISQKIDYWLSIYPGDKRTYLKYEWLKGRWEATKADAGWRVERSRQLRESFERSKG